MAGTLELIGADDGPSNQEPQSNALRAQLFATRYMNGRFGFLIHPGNMTTKASSLGCIVLPLDVINTIGKSNDNCLAVIP